MVSADETVIGRSALADDGSCGGQFRALRSRCRRLSAIAMSTVTPTEIARQIAEAYREYDDARGRSLTEQAIALFGRKAMLAVGCDGGASGAASTALAAARHADEIGRCWPAVSRGAVIMDRCRVILSSSRGDEVCGGATTRAARSEEHTSELQSP